jgi:putative Holliday junction resolvase
MNRQTLIGLDVGEKRIGVSVADTGVRIAVPFMTIEVDGDEIQTIAEVVSKEGADVLVLGYPRNQSGEATTQTDYVEKFAERLTDLEVKIAYQDESLTSVMAEQQLISHKKPYTKGDIDAQAAAIILQDYLEVNYG